MVIKRKATAQKGGALSKCIRAAAEAEEVDHNEKDVDMQNEDEQEEIEDQEETEHEIVAARTKELKGMYVHDLTNLVSKKGIDCGKKRDDMIKAIIVQEVQERASVREHEAKLRNAILQKREELEAMLAPELKRLCTNKGLTGILSKQARVEGLLKQWQEDGGIDKALVKMAQDAREAELKAMDVETLQKFCVEVGINPFVKEVMIDRIVRCELDAGQFAPPAMPQEEEQEDAQKQKGSLVDALLAKEAKRKADEELKLKQEEAAANKLKEFKAMTVDDLKKAIAGAGQNEPAGNKNDLIKVLFNLHLQEVRDAEKKSKLQSMDLDHLQKLVSSQGLQVENKKNKMIEALLANEVRLREAVAAHETKKLEVLTKKKEEFEQLTGNQLIELCAGKGVASSGNKESRIERLLEEAKTSGEADRLVALISRDARIVELNSADTNALNKLCKDLGADPLIKDVMVERMVAHERALGQFKV